MNTPKPHEAFLRARRALLMDHAFFGSAVMYLDPVEDSKCEIMWVDGKSVGYNPEALEALSVNEAAGVLATKVLSCLFEHPLRREQRDAKLWNDACAYVVNPVVRDGGLPLPQGALGDARYNGLLAEEVYEALHAAQQQQQSGKNAAPQQQKGQNGAGALGGKSEQNQQLNSDSSAATGEKPQQNQGVSDASRKTGPTSPTSAFPQSGYPHSDPEPKTQQQAPAQATAAASHATGEVRDLPPGEGSAAVASPAERTANAQEWQIAMQQALNNAEAQGQLPAGLKRVVEQALETRTPWKDELRQFFQSVARDDLSWMRPNRRYLQRKIYMPSVHSTRMGPVVFVVDTSGSIGARIMQQFEGEANALVEDVQPEVTYVLYVDASAYPDREEGYTAEDLPIKFNAKGGGGTDFRAAFNWVEEKGLEPACLVYLTDLMGTFPAQEPDYPVLWACTNSRKAPFGHTIHIK